MLFENPGSAVFCPGLFKDPVGLNYDRTRRWAFHLSRRITARRVRKFEAPRFRQRLHELLFFSFPLMEKKQKIKPIRWSSFPVIVVFFLRIGGTTPLFVMLKVLVFAACYSKTLEALCSVWVSLKLWETQTRTEQGAGLFI